AGDGAFVNFDHGDQCLLRNELLGSRRAGRQREQSQQGEGPDDAHMRLRDDGLEDLSKISHRAETGAWANTKQSPSTTITSPSTTAGATWSFSRPRRWNP